MKGPNSAKVRNRDASEWFTRLCLIFFFVSASFLFGSAVASGFCNEYARYENQSCKNHPTIKGAVIVASASPQEGVEDPENKDFDLDIAVIDAGTRKTIAHGAFKAKITNGGGPRFSRITLDTGDYVVSPGLRAFGVRASLHMNLMGSEELNLFLVRGDSIVSVLSGMTAGASFSNGASDCRLQTREVKRTLSMDRRMTEGFYDILVLERVNDTNQHKNQTGECESVEGSTARQRYRLKFDGKEYRIPGDMLELDCRVC
ncbi:MAG: hypothetical protein ACK5TK_04425 [Betaproteobacteria bacterium]